MNRLSGTAIVNALIAGFIIGVGLGGFLVMAGGLGPMAGLISRMPTIGGPAVVAAPSIPAPSVAAKVEQPAAAAQAATELKVVATDLKFTPNKLTARVGQLVKVVLENKGVIEHDILIPAKASGASADTKSDLVKPGQTVTVEFTPTAKGNYEFFCTVPGHREAGMKGTLTVQ